MRESRTVRLASIALVAWGCGCSSTTRRNDWAVYSGPGAAYFQKEEVECPLVPDPFEPTNRVAWAVNDFLLFEVLAPISAAWRFLVPQPVRTGLVNAADNITFPIRAVSNLLQGEVADAGQETRRFLVNSTIGVLGLFDVAGPRQIEAHDEDMGRVLANWGWTESTYLVLPLFGPRTARDTIGLLADSALDPTTYYPPASPIKTFVVDSEHLDSAKRFVRTAFDPYALARLAWMSGRRTLERRYDDVAHDAFADQLLRSLHVQLEDPSFPAQARTRSVRVPGTGRKLAYDVWLQPEPAPMVFILPGLGAHRRSKLTLVAAEMAFRHGCSAVTISSVMNFEFLENASTVSLPGFAPADAEDCHAALDAIYHDIEHHFPGRMKARVLLGISLGGLDAIFLAAAAGDPQVTFIDFDRYVALNPPIDMRYSAEQLDRLYNVPMVYHEATRRAWIEKTLYKAAQANLAGGLNEVRSIPFTRNEAEFLVGLSFRWALHDVIWISQIRDNMGVLQTPLRPLRRNAASREILEFSYMEYFYAFVVPYYQKHRIGINSADDLFALLDPRRLGGNLPPMGKIRVFTNDKDVLVTAEQIRLMKELFGPDNVISYPTGGHLGTLSDPVARNEIMAVLDDLR